MPIIKVHSLGRGQKITNPGKKIREKKVPEKGPLEKKISR